MEGAARLGHAARPPARPPACLPARLPACLAQTPRHFAQPTQPAVLFVRPRGWHLPESHFLVDGVPCPGALFDFGLFFWHNARELVARGSGPYFYLPKMQSHLEARLWNDVFLDAQHAVGLPVGTVKATVLIETLPAAFEMDEILYELRAHSAGLNCGRWDYIFSLIKTLREDPKAVVPDRCGQGKGGGRGVGAGLRRARRGPSGVARAPCALHAQPTPQPVTRATPSQWRGHDDAALHAVVLAAAHQDVPPPGRARNGGDGGTDPY